MPSDMEGSDDSGIVELSPEENAGGKHEICLVCGSKSLEPLQGYERCYLVQCQSCDFVFVDRIPTEDELTEHYSRAYSENSGGYEWLSSITTKRFFEWLDYLEKYRKVNRMLDVGCGVGHFLQHAKQRDWKVSGTEYPPNAVEICRKKGIEMHGGSIGSSHYADESFDVITWLGVIEHIYNPNEDLEHIYRLLRPGGLLYITTPNFDSLSRHLLGPKWNVIMYPEHLSYYTVGTLSRVLKQNGFEKEKIRATGFSFSRVGASLRTQRLKYVSPDCMDEKVRETLEYSKFLNTLKRGINRVLTMTRKGDELTVAFEKPEVAPK